MLSEQVGWHIPKALWLSLWPTLEICMNVVQKRGVRRIQTFSQLENVADENTEGQSYESR